MAVVSRPPTGHSQQHRKAQQARAGRSNGVLYGSSGELGVGEGGRAAEGLHHKEWNARAHGSRRTNSASNSGTMLKSGRRGGEAGSGVTYNGEFAGGSFGSWCGGCMTRSGAMSPPPRVATRQKLPGSGEVKLSGDIGSLRKNFSGGFERTTTPGSSPAFRPRLSPGKVSPLVEVVPPAANANATQVVQAPVAPVSAVFSMGSCDAWKMNSGREGVSSSPPVEKIKASPTLFEMMTHEQELQGVKTVHTLSLSQQLAFQEKMKTILSGSSPGNQFNDASSSDLKLTLNNREGYSVTVNVHRHILVSHSRFFAAKLSDRWSKQQRTGTNPNLIEITDIDDLEIYLETLRLIYCEDVKCSLMKENVGRILAILKLSAHIMFEGGVFSCLEYLEAVPWADDEEEKVTALMGQLQLESVGVAADVMKRCSGLESSNSEDVLVRLLQSVTKGTDDKARREMKSLVSRLLRENMSLKKNTLDVSKESLYRACHGCLDSLLHLFMLSKGGADRSMLVEIARQADNLHWLVDILIDRGMVDDFVRMWAHQAELASLHAQVPVMFRYEVSRLTARLCIAIGKGQVLSPKDVRFLLLSTWLQPLVDDFAWMQRCCRNLDKKVVEEGISQTILTLPLKQQQSILLSWFDRFLNSGDDCPNLQKAFEVWWRRTFTRPCSLEDVQIPHQRSSF